MKVLYATDGLEPATMAGHLLEKIGDRERIEVTVMSVTHTGIPAPEHLPLVIDPVSPRREDTLAIVDAAVEKLLSGRLHGTGSHGGGTSRTGDRTGGRERLVRPRGHGRGW